MALSALFDQQRSGNLLQSIAHPNVVNPLAAMQAGQQAAGTMWDLRQKQAQQAAGEAYQGAIGPDGRFDPLKYNQLLAGAGPAAALAAKGGIESSTTIAGQQMDQAGKMSGALNSAVSAALQADDAHLKDAVLEQSHRLIAAGFPAQHVMGGLLNLSSDAPTLRQQLMTMQFQNMPPEKQFEVLHGQQLLVPQGGYTGAVTRDPRTGAITPKGALPTYPSIESSTAVSQVMDLQHEIPDPNNPGQMIKNDNYGRFIPITERDKRIAAGADPSLFGPPGSALGNGRYGNIPAPLQNPNVPPAPNAAPAKPYTTPSGVSTVGPSAADTSMIAQSGEQFTKVSNEGTESKPRSATLGNMMVDTGVFAPGPGQMEKFKQAMVTWAPPIAKAFGITPEKVAGMESFDKLAATIVNQQAAHSDAAMNLLVAATPDKTKTAAGVDLILRQLIGNEDYLQARTKLADAYPNRSDFAGFQKVARNLDPRVFQLARMTQSQRDEYWNNPKLDQRTKDELAAGIRFASQNKLFNTAAQ